MILAPSGTNTNYTFGGTFNYDTIVIYSDYITLGDMDVKITASNPINVTLITDGTSSKVFNVTNNSGVSSGQITFHLTDFEVSLSGTILTSPTTWTNTIRSSSLGEIDFTHDGVSQEETFTISLTGDGTGATSGVIPVTTTTTTVLGEITIIQGNFFDRVLNIGGTKITIFTLIMIVLVIIILSKIKYGDQD